MAKQIVRVNYDDQPNDVADSFAEALKALGIQCTMIEPKDDEVWLDYVIEVEDTE